MSVADVVDSLGHIAERSQLIARGLHPTAIASALRAGSIVRVRRAWCATDGASEDQLVAVRIGGRLGGPTACASYGNWTPETSAVHVSLARNASRLRPSPARGRPVILDWTADAGSRPHPFVPAWRVDAESAIAQTLRLVGSDEAVAVLDSALHAGMISQAAMQTVLRDTSPRHRLLAPLTDEQAESGTESLVRFRLAERGIMLSAQVRVPGVGRVDFLAGDRLVIEVDGYRFHHEPSDFARDRARDLTLAALGFRVIRLSYRQVVSDWSATEAAILALIDTGEHLAAARFSG